MRKFFFFSTLLLALAAPALPLRAMNIDVPAGDVPALIAAITTANNTPGPDVINLSFGVYTLTDFDNDEDVIDNGVSIIRGTNGLPIITDELTINGGGATIERANGTPQFRILAVYSTVTLNNLTIRNGSAYWPAQARADNGGGIFNYGDLTLNECQILDNTASGGGGIASANEASLTINQSLISGNIGTGWGGGIVHNSLGNLVINETTISDNVAGRDNPGFLDTPSGAGIAIEAGEVSINASTISGNESKGPFSLGGGIYTVNGIFGMIEVGQNSTISGNRAGRGAGIYANGTFAIHNTTVADNIASSYAGGIYAAAANHFDFLNSILSDNQPTNCDFLNGPFKTYDNNLDTDGTCGAGGLSNVDSLLAPLGYYGGMTRTHALLPGSPAIDAGDPATCTTHDQRGKQRDSSCDIGAYEALEPTVIEPPDAAPYRNIYTIATPTLNWSPVASASMFEIQVDDDRNFSSVNYVNPAIPAGTSSYMLQAALLDGLYYWRIRTKANGDSWGAWSQVESFYVDAS